jgi:phosphatidate cytidylyltransferase
MKERIVTAVVLIGVILIVAFINNQYLTGLFISAITIAALYEGKKLFKVDDENIFLFLSFLSILSIFINPVFVGVVGVLGVGGYVAYNFKDIKNVSLAIYPFLPMMLFYEIYLKMGIEAIGWLILIVALTDSFAYFIGKNFGKKLFKRGFCVTSPNKSIEGVMGGVIFGTILGSLVGLYFFNFYISFLVSFMISFVSVFGDLFESLLKRKAGVKDSGNILPGHGGVLDRIDAYLFAAPLFFAIFYAMGSL